ncbi:MAG: 4-hydroxy-3-methylbut-2-enyl diphosphate reductase [Verrucomicrobia bacterium]|nr:MAG: 4-hydroxy-3-methylbut-2-enyl diphosphate reductase [Verrucomicrobiota bacterium]
MATGASASLARPLPDLVAGLHENAVRIAYLNLPENDYIYRFRTDKQRNRSVYLIDERARDLYHSTLCETIKAAKRSKERTSAEPAVLDFGPVRYVLPSHFGFCLGVQNAIERAYETLNAHRDRRVFMLSELIHNPFVNEDLRIRGLLYIQSDKGVPLNDPETRAPYWHSLTSDDIVIIPAFGAADEDKRKLIEKGIAVRRHDATCMLVEKVWKTARHLGQNGYTVIIHGKAEHEETKATFSNSAKYAPSLIVRNLSETRRLGKIILEPDPIAKRQQLRHFSGNHTPGFDPSTDLDRVAVVNQTTLLRNETVAIIDYLESVFGRKHGKENTADHLYGQSRGDTLCYATQVNQDSLERALQQEVDVAVVVGGRNSSNTYQLFRLCANAIGNRAFYVQSESNIRSLESIEHYCFPIDPSDPAGGRTEVRSFLSPQYPIRILITGGASCPDGIIQKIIERINGLIGHESLRSIDKVMAAVTSP